MAEATLIAPLANIAASIIETIYDYSDTDESVVAFIQSVQQLHESLNFLQANVDDRRLRRSRFAHLEDPVESQLSILLSNIHPTYEATEQFFAKYRITKDAKIPGVHKMGANIFTQEIVKSRLMELQMQYHFHAMQTSIVSQALYNQTLKEFGTTVEANNNQSRARRRLDDPTLLVRPKSISTARTSTYETWAAEPKVYGQPITETQFRAPVVIEDELRLQVQGDCTEAQHWLFKRFERELLISHPEGIKGFELLELLNKAVFWLSHCNGIWPHEEMEYSFNYVQLMKAAWLLRETMSHIPPNRTSNALNESYLIEIQNTVIAMHPINRNPPVMWALEKLREDSLSLYLTERARPETDMPMSIITIPEDRELEDIPEFVAFEKTVPCPPINDRHRLVRVLRHKDYFSEDTTLSKGLDDTISILEEVSYVQRDGSLFSTKIEETKYGKLATYFTPVFASSKYSPVLDPNAGTNPDEIIHIRKRGNDARDVYHKQFPFWKQADIEDFEHALTGYSVKQTIDAESSELTARGWLGRRKRLPISTTYTQIWCPEALKKLTKDRSDFHGSPISSHGISRKAVLERSTPVPGSPMSPGPGSIRSGVFSSPSSIYEGATKMMPNGSHYSRDTGLSKMSQISRKVNFLNDPEPAKLLIYGRNGDYDKRLIILPIDEKIELHKDCCIERLKTDDHGISCCADVAVSWNPRMGKGEAALYTAEKNDIAVGGNWKQNRETARIALPLDVRTWPTGGESIKFDRIKIRFRNKLDKVAFVDNFTVYRGLYLSNQSEFEVATRERRLRHTQRN